MEEWLNSIINHPHKCEIYAKLHPDNKNKEITYSQIDFYAKQLLFLISCFRNGGHIPLVPPPSPAERALQAEKLAEIGVRGEQFILEREQEKLDRLGLLDKDYPKHVALISDSYGYDILSRDEQGKELYIEVKTTTRKEGEWGANRFYLSAREYAFYREHKEQYRLYRVHDINGTPTFTVFSDLDKLELQPDSYVAQY